MSDFVPRDILPELWEEILRRHWTFLETEESMQKLEERKKLEGCLKEFLCIVPHDRKFFLPETAHVLKKSIKELDDFSAYKAMIGFESISQYANNLFTKPWRKEYRVIKMYSGFYQHEIKSNLVDAEKLFEAMGYRQLPNQILVLDGPICPDQVTNVSRDAMAAYVECQIMKQVFSGITSMQLSCSWVDVFNFRELHVGGATHAAKGIAYMIREKRFRKEKLNSENCYATIQHCQKLPAHLPPTSQQMVSSCSNCTHPYHVPPQHLTNGCEIHQHQQQIYSNVPPCSVHSQPSNGIYNNMHFKQPTGYSQMSHSKSLEHYADHNIPTAEMAPPLPHRHSFDQPPACESQRNQQQHLYETPYDCVDGYQKGCQFNAYSHPYNVSGNRYPLPYNISSQLNNQYACVGGQSPHYQTVSTNGSIIAGCGHKVPIASSSEPMMYNDCNGFTKKTPHDHLYHNPRGVINQAKDFQTYRQRSFPPDQQQLIDFDEGGPPMPSHHSRSQSRSFDYAEQLYENRSHNKLAPNRLMAITNHQTPKDLYNRNIESSDDVDGNYIYSGRVAEKKRQSAKTVERTPIANRYDSYEDTVKTLPKTIKNKNQDGVGSFESWDYVFQNLEKHGYSKDLGERGDLLVQSLDLDSMKLAEPSVDKQRLRPRNTDTIKSRLTQPNETKPLDLPSKPQRSNGIEKSSSIPNKQLHEPQPSAKPIRSSLKNGTSNNNLDEVSRVTVNGSAMTATTVIVTSPSEWSCRFCTFLNPESKRICEMCCRSKDFNVTNTPTCV